MDAKNENLTSFFICRLLEHRYFYNNCYNANPYFSNRYRVHYRCFTETFV